MQGLEGFPDVPSLAAAMRRSLGIAHLLIRTLGGARDYRRIELGNTAPCQDIWITIVKRRRLKVMLCHWVSRATEIPRGRGDRAR